MMDKTITWNPYSQIWEYQGAEPESLEFFFLGKWDSPNIVECVFKSRKTGLEYITHVMESEEFTESEANELFQFACDLVKINKDPAQAAEEIRSRVRKIKTRDKRRDVFVLVYKKTDTKIKLVARSKNVKEDIPRVVVLHKAP